jgi:hypothetical protein
MQRLIRFIEIFTFFAAVPFMPVILLVVVIIMEKLGL